MDGEKNLGIEKTEGTEGTTSNGAALTEPGCVKTLNGVK